MQTFAKKKIALAVGASLLVMAGAAQATTPPVARATNPAVVSALGTTNDANIRSLLSTTGLAGQTVTISVNLSSGVVTGGIAGDIQAVLPGAPTVLVTTLNVADATLANRNVLVYTGTLGLTTVLPVTSATFVPDGTSTAGTASINVLLTAPTGTGAYRVNAGNLEFSSATGVAFAPVKIDVQAAAAVGAIIYTESTGASPATNAGYIAAEDQIMSLATVNGTVKSSLAPTPAITTTGSSAGLVNGFVIDTGTPITLAAANLDVKTDTIGIAAVPGVTFNAATTIPAAAMGAPVCALSKCTVTFAGLGTVATAADYVTPVGTPDAADAAIYTSTNFNTGVNAAKVPFSVDGVNASKASYTEVFNVADGLVAKLADSSGVATGDSAAFPAVGASITDGASPVIVASGITFSTPSTATPALTNVGITFSEDMTAIGPNDLREVLENVFVGANSLAVLSMNSNVTPTLGGLSLVNGQDTLTINGLAATDVATLAGGVWTGKSMSVARGITLQEINDTNYTANVAAGTTLDDDPGTGPNGEQLAGGIKSATGSAVLIETIPATPVAQVAVAPTPTIAWGTDTSALASASSSSAPDQIDTIRVTFAAGKSVKLAPAATVFGTATALAAAKTNADLAANLVVDVFGNNGIKFQVRPLSATLDSATQITVVLPTALIYSKLTSAGTQLKSVWIGYNADGTNNANNTLVSATAGLTPSVGEILAEGLTSATNGAWVDGDLLLAGAEPVVLPKVFTSTATGGQSTLLTQNIQTTIAGSAAGAQVNAYLAYWNETPTTVPTMAAGGIKSGKISNPGDKVATDLAIEFVSTAALAAVIQTQLQAVVSATPAKPGISEAVTAVKAALIPVYVKLVRSNDTANANAQTGSQNYLNARAILATTYAAADGGSDNSNDSQSPIYEVLLDPVTGVISGRLTGKIELKAGKSTTTARGLVFLDNDGTAGAATVIGSSIVAQKAATGLPASPSATFLNLLMGVDPVSVDTAALLKLNPFVLLTHQDSTGNFTLLTSADPTAANYLPFAPDLFNLATGTNGVAVRAASLLSVTDVKKLPLVDSSLWALYGLGNPALAAKPVISLKPEQAFPRRFVGLDTAGVPVSFWTNDTTEADLALTMAGNQVGVATETSSGLTLATISPANMVKGANALAWANDNGDAATNAIFVAQATGTFAPAVAAPAPTLGKGWSLVTVPASATLGSAVDAVIKVGAQVGNNATLTNAGTGVGQFSWFAADGAMPALTAGEAVFVHAKAAGAL